MSLSIVHPRKQGHSGPSLFISGPLPPAWNECIFLSAPRMAGLGQGQGQARRRTRLETALGPFPGFSGDWKFASSPQNSASVTWLPRPVPRRLPPSTTDTDSLQQVVQSPKLPVGRSSPSFSSIGRAQPQIPPYAALRWYNRPQPRRAGKVHCATARGGGREEPEEAEGSLQNFSVGSTLPVEARRGLATSSRRPFLIGRARSSAPPPCPRLRERSGPEFAKGRIGRALRGGGTGE